MATRNVYAGKPTKARQEEIRETVEDALDYSLEIYGVYNMAKDSGLNQMESEWARDNVSFRAIIVK